MLSYTLNFRGDMSAFKLSFEAELWKFQQVEVGVSWKLAEAVEM